MRYDSKRCNAMQSDLNAKALWILTVIGTHLFQIRIFNMGIAQSHTDTDIDTCTPNIQQT